MKIKNIGNKLFTLFVILVFVIGTIPLAFAKEGEDGDSNSGSDSEKNSVNSGKGKNGSTIKAVAGLKSSDGTDGKTIGEIRLKDEIKDEIKVTVEIVGDKSNVKIRNRFSTAALDRSALIDEAIKRFALDKEAVSKIVKFETKQDEELENDRLRIKAKTKKGLTEVETELRFILDTTNKEAIINEIVARSKLDRQELERAFELKVELEGLKFKEFRQKFVESLNERELEVFTHLSIKAKQWCSEHPRECEKRIENWKLEKAKDKRKVTKERLVQLQEKFLLAKENFELAEKRYLEQKEQFSAAKEKLKACKDDDQSEQCKKLRELAVDKAKRMVQHSIELLTNHLEKIKQRIQENENIAEDEATKIVAEIDAELKLLAEVSTKVEAAKTKEEVKSLAKEVQELWRKYKHRAKFHALHVANARIRGIVERSEKVEDKFQCALNKLELDGKDIVEIDALVEKYNVKVAAAREHYTKAKASFKNAIELRTSKELTEAEIGTIIKLNNQGKAHLDEAKAAIKEAHELVKDIVKAIKNKGGDVESCNKVTEQQAETSEDFEVVTENNVALDEEINVVAKAEADTSSTSGATTSTATNTNTDNGSVSASATASATT